MESRAPISPTGAPAPPARGSSLLDDVPRQVIDDLTRLAAQITGAPVAVLTAGNGTEEEVRAIVSTLATELPDRFPTVPLDPGADRAVTVIGNAGADARLHNHPLAALRPPLRFIAAVPVQAPDCPDSATLYVLDVEPRSLTPEQQWALAVLAREVCAHADLQRSAGVLAESERRLRAIFDNEPECVKLLGPGEIVLDINPAGVRMIEANDAGELVGRSIRELIVPAHRAAFHELAERVRHGATGTLAFEIITMKGARRWVESHAAPLRDEHGQVDAVLSITRDITEQRRAEQHIKHLNRMYALLSRTNQLLVRQKQPELVLNGACRIAIDEGQFEMAWIGIRKGDSVAQNIEAHAGADADTLALMRQLIEHETDPPGCVFTAAALTTGHLAVCNDIATDPRAEPWRRAALTRDYGAMTSLPLHVRGRVLGTFNLYAHEPGFFDRHELLLLDELAANIGFALEVHEQDADRQRVEAALHESEEQLRQSQKMEAIGQLAGGVAHDFNNMLTVIHGYGSLLLSAHPSGDEEHEAAQEIVRACEKAANLTRQLLAFSRRQVMQPRRIDLNDVVTSLARMMHRVLGEDVVLQLTLDPRPLVARADPGMIDQVLMNLMVNAREAMPGGGHLTIETSEQHIRADEQDAGAELPAGRYVSLRVSDTGRGIAAAVLPRIFEPFFTTKEPGKGTGLGLATVFGIVKQHAGGIRVDSVVGSGTAFQILLPALDESIAVDDEAPARAVRGGNETILIVEDEPGLRRLTQLLLARQGYRVLEAANGLEALRVWTEQRGAVQLLLTDIVMPEGISGRDLATQLQVQQPGLRVVFTSGYSADIAGRELSLQEGRNFLQKPFSRQQLLEIVRSVLDHGL